MKVCIVGSGLTALTLAKALVNQKLFVDIVSDNVNFKINQSRTIGISRSNFDYFNKNIINIEKIVWKLKKIEIYTDNLKNEKILNFENNNNQLFSTVKNFKLYEIINKSLSNSKFCKKIKLKNALINFNDYNLIINTDFSNLFTKKFFNKKIIKTYNSMAYTTIIEHENISNHVAVQIFTKKGPLAFLPISKNKTSIVYSIHNSNNNSKENCNHLIRKYNLKYKIKKINKIETFDLHSCALRNYYHKNILAFGDLLHRIHPLAGQGFNMTIRDINILTDIINQKIDLGLSIDSSINSQFENKLKHKNYIFSNGIDLIHEFFNFERKFDNTLFSKSVKLLGKHPYINNFFTKIADKGINI
ncbi:FAD-dependent monooxygenase [Candidatus Pelagibacter sp.]|nr:FAD-dependent monooxygenase [Candidatus Pelagibacter sp.]